MLCQKCSKGKYIRNLGTCKNCGSSTSSGAFNLCRGCSALKGECAHCNAKLSSGSGSPKSK